MNDKEAIRRAVLLADLIEAGQPFAVIAGKVWPITEVEVDCVIGPADDVLAGCVVLHGDDELDPADCSLWMLDDREAPSTHTWPLTAPTLTSGRR